MSETRAHGDDAVAVIGAGVAGLSCAVALSRALPEREIHIFDQGSRGRGGRTSSSRPSAHDDPLVFDHGCQFFTASDPEFKAVCASLVRSGHASRWDGRFGTLDARTGAFASRDDARGDVPDDDFFGLLSADEVFVGVPTMRGLCDGLRAAAGGHLVIDHPHCAVTDLSLGLAASTPRWTARGVDHRTLDVGARGDPERHLGEFRAVVAADVMLAKTGTPGDCSLRRRAARIRRSSRLERHGERAARPALHARRRLPHRRVRRRAVLVRRRDHHGLARRSSARSRRREAGTARTTRPPRAMGRNLLVHFRAGRRRRRAAQRRREV